MFICGLILPERYREGALKFIFCATVFTPFLAYNEIIDREVDLNYLKVNFITVCQPPFNINGAQIT